VNSPVKLLDEFGQYFPVCNIPYFQYNDHVACKTRRHMSTVRSLIDKIRDVATSSSDQGSRFEGLIRQYFLHDPLYSEQFTDVWRWNDWQGKGKEPDTGIDLVAKNRYDDGYTAIQCKCWSENDTIQRSDIDSFLVRSAKKPFTRRIIVTTTAKWSKHAEDAIHGQPVAVQRLDINDLENSTIDWSQFDPDKAEVKQKPKKELFDHQITALDQVREGYETQDRGQLIMACGTGKTFTSLKIAEEHAGKDGLVLFLVPSLSLLQQTLREWTAESVIPLHCYAVCSDVKIGKHDDSTPLSPDDLAIPATTDAESLTKSFALSEKMTVVFATYQSIDVLRLAQSEHGMPEFDIIICDEAHRTTGARLEGDDESHFVKVHDNNTIKGKKRLYMTATPRLYSADSKAKAKQRDVPLWSMDNEDHYGKVFYYLGFSSAVSQGLLSDYKVVILGVDEYMSPFIEAAAVATGKKKKELPLVDPAKIIGCWNALAGKYDDGRKPILHRAVAFTTSIKQSETFRSQFDSIVTEYRNKSGDTDKKALHCEVEHVDGTRNAIKRNELLQWLKDKPKRNECRILSNARCLSEGVDVPALDAVMFLTPRKSKVDVVQSVGRVMRKAEGKEYGYVIIPIVIKAGTKPEDALNDSEAYEMVWGVLQALRAHDDQFQNQINVFELDGKLPEKIEVHFIGSATAPSALSETREIQDEQQLLGFSYDDIKIWKNALYATLVKKCGEKRYWEDWAKDVAKLAQQHIETLQKLADDETHKYDFVSFLDHLRSNLNDSITEQDAIEMLAQHIITKPVFDALFDSEDFSKNNPVAQALDKVVALLEDVEADTKAGMERSAMTEFYESVRTRVAGVKTAEGRQKIIIELYDKFFKTAFPKLSEKLGIVYTPVEVVDFIIKSVDQALRQEFGVGITDKDIHVLDPFTGTGTFIVRLLQSGLIAPKDLQRKYENELHANELVLLAYYIAAINIENTYRELTHQSRNRKVAQSDSQSTDCGSEAFPGIVHTDTFTMTQDKKLVDDVNSQRAKRQKETPINVIIGNPPYSVGQRSANDDNQNTAYPQLDERIKNTYAHASNAALQRNLYDSYIRAFRWASDRIGEKGILSFVTNGGWIDKNAMDGFRKCLGEEFTDIYVFSLRGGIRGRAGDAAKREGQNVFPIMTAVAITLLIKNPKKQSRNRKIAESDSQSNDCGSVIHYYEFDDYLKQNEKLQILADADGLQGVQWKPIIPNEKHDWINQRDDTFDSFISLGDKKDKDAETVFNVFAIGVATNRDAWCYNFSKEKLTGNMTRMIEFYNEQVEACKERKEWDKEITVEQFVDADPKKIAWTRALRNDARKTLIHSHNKKAYCECVYRPFTKQLLYYDKPFIESPGLWSQIFPEPGIENVVICVTSIGSRKDFCTIISDTISDLELVEKAQCFPLYTYERIDQSRNRKVALLDSQSTDCGSDGERIGDYIRRENISDAMLQKFRERYNELSRNRKIALTKEDIFYYVYGILHSRSYRERFASDLKKQLPRIPMVDDFWTFSQAGRKLAELHLNYETGKMYPVIEVWGRGFGDSPTPLSPESFRMTKMRFPSKTDKSRIIYNDQLHLAGIPAEAYRYVVNGKSALEWIVERYAVTTHKDSGIVNDPNDWCKEIGNNRYIVDLVKRIVHLSVESVKIIDGLPEVRF